MATDRDATEPDQGGAHAGSVHPASAGPPPGCATAQRRRHNRTARRRRWETCRRTGAVEVPCRLWARTPQPTRRRALLFAGTGIGLAVLQAAYFAAVQDTGLAVGTIVTLGAAPESTAAGGRLFLGERPGRAGLPAVGGTLAGLAIPVPGNQTGVVHPVGLEMALLSAAGAAAGAGPPAMSPPPDHGGSPAFAAPRRPLRRCAGDGGTGRARRCRHRPARRRGPRGGWCQHRSRRCGPAPRRRSKRRARRRPG